jgi:glycosyltransferase involved in cell wall biosynthesis
MADERRRVLVLTSTFPASPGDGTPEFVLTLSRELGKLYDVHVLCPRVRNAPRHERIDEIEVHRFPYFPRRWERIAEDAILPGLRAEPWRIIEAASLMFAFLLATVRYALRLRPDVVNAHWIIPAGLGAAIVRAMRKIPYVLTVHGADAYALNGRPFSSVKAAVVARAAAVAPVSRDIARRLQVPEGNVVPMGVDFESMQQEVGNRDPVPGRLLFIGRLAEKKGVDVLLRAIEATPKAELVIVGDGPDRSALEALAAQLDIDDRVDFCGTQTRDGVAAQLRTASAVVIPSRRAKDGDQDGTPVVLGEAVAAGVPVIVSRLGGLSEHVSDGVTGRVVAPESVTELATAISEIIDNPLEAEQFAAAAQATAYDTLGLGATVAGYESFLETAVAGASE